MVGTYVNGSSCLDTYVFLCNSIWQVWSHKFLMFSNNIINYIINHIIFHIQLYGNSELLRSWLSAISCNHILQIPCCSGRFTPNMSTMVNLTFKDSMTLYILMSYDTSLQLLQPYDAWSWWSQLPSSWVTWNYYINTDLWGCLWLAKTNFLPLLFLFG